MKKIERIAIWFLLGLMLGGFLAAICPTKAHACDEQFIQEPSWKDPVSTQLDWGVGFAFLTYSFIDGRKLVAIYRLAPVDISEEPRSMDEHPLFYVVIESDGKRISYIDREERGECSEINRYEPITFDSPQPLR